MNDLSIWYWIGCRTSTFIFSKCCKVIDWKDCNSTSKLYKVYASESSLSFNVIGIFEDWLGIEDAVVSISIYYMFSK